MDHGAVSPSLERLADRAEQDVALRAIVQRGFDRAIERRPEAFRRALSQARDIAAQFLVGTWDSIDQESFELAQIPSLMHEIDSGLTGGLLGRILSNNLEFRGIGLIGTGPKAADFDDEAHSNSARMLAP